MLAKCSGVLCVSVGEHERKQERGRERERTHDTHSRASQSVCVVLRERERERRRERSRNREITKLWWFLLACLLFHFAWVLFWCHNGAGMVLNYVLTMVGGNLVSKRCCFGDIFDVKSNFICLHRIA